MKKYIVISLAAVILLLLVCGLAQCSAMGSSDSDGSATGVTDGTTATATADPDTTQGITHNPDATQGTTGSPDATQGTTTGPDATQGATQGTTQSATQGAAQSAAQGTTQPPATKPSTQPSTQISTQPSTQPVTQPATNPPATQPPATTAPSSSATVLTLDKSTVTISVPMYVFTDLTATYNGDKTLTWTSSNTAVATVNSNGRVWPQGLGTAVITVTDGTLSAKCNVVVDGILIRTKSSTTVFVGETLQIDCEYSGDKAALTWSSTDPSVLTVDANGVVIGVAEGSATVKVTDGTFTGRVSITVSAAPKTTSIEMNGFNAPLYDGVVKYAGDYMTIRAWTLPYESNRDITVTSSNNSVVSVSWQKDSTNDNNITLNFKSAGTAKITITSADGCVSKSYTITVKSDYDFNPGPGLLTPEQFVNCYNGIVSANGMSTSGMPTGYLVYTFSDSELTWATARRNAEGRFHAWWLIGYRTIVLTYEGVNERGNHVFYVRGHS